MAKALLPCIALAALFCFVQANPAHSGTAIKARLYSPNASEEASGTLMLDGFNLSGHLSGGGIDVLVSGIVKNSSVQVDVVGHLLVSCGLNRQSMSGTAPNAGPSTSVEMTFTCDKRFMGGDYLFRLDLGLPTHQLQIPAGSDPGESAAINPTSGKVQRNPA